MRESTGAEKLAYYNERMDSIHQNRLRGGYRILGGLGRAIGFPGGGRDDFDRYNHPACWAAFAVFGKG